MYKEKIVILKRTLKVKAAQKINSLFDKYQEGLNI